MSPHVDKIHVIVNKIWPLGDKTVKVDVFVVNDKTVKFRIRDSAIRLRVLRRGMWNIADIPMVFQSGLRLKKRRNQKLKLCRCGLL